MAPRIPPSLKWLIDKRARLDGEIQKTRTAINNAKILLEELATLEESLAAVDQTLALHDVQIDVDLITPVRSHYTRINMPHGELTKSILLCLRLREGNTVRMSEIVTFVEARCADLGAPISKRAGLARSVHYRLKNLAREGVILRHHPKEYCKEGLWSIAPSCS